MRYLYLGDRHTRPELVGQPCDPVLRPDGKCIVGGSKQLVVFADGTEVVVMRRRLRIVKPATHDAAHLLRACADQAAWVYGVHTMPGSYTDDVRWAANRFLAEVRPATEDWAAGYRAAQALAEAASWAPVAEDLPTKYDRHEDCPRAHKHTKAPTGYMERESWAERKARKHVQTQCSTCGFWVVWRRRKPREELPWLVGPVAASG